MHLKETGKCVHAEDPQFASLGSSLSSSHPALCLGSVRIPEPPGFPLSSAHGAPAGGSRKVRTHSVPLFGMLTSTGSVKGHRTEALRPFFWLSLSLGWYLQLCYSGHYTIPHVPPPKTLPTFFSSIKPSLNYPSLSVLVCQDTNWHNIPIPNKLSGSLMEKTNTT